MPAFLLLLTLCQMEVQMSQEREMSLQEAIKHFLSHLKRKSSSKHTIRNYTKALDAFCNSLIQRDINPKYTPVSDLRSDWLGYFLDDLSEQAASTERVYSTIVACFYRFVAAEELAEINLARLNLRLRERRSIGRRLPRVPAQEIETIISSTESLLLESLPLTKRLIVLRDSAFLTTLADTGLRLAEACSLRRGDMDWADRRARVRGKGGHEDIVRFSTRALSRLRRYLAARQVMDSQQGCPLSQLPLFARHDRKAGKRILPISPRTGEEIVARAVIRALGKGARGQVTPHDFRRYFVTNLMRATGDIHLAQRAARHASIHTTIRYTRLDDEELDEVYDEIFG